MRESVCPWCAAASTRMVPYPHPQSEFFRPLTVALCAGCQSGRVVDDITPAALDRYYREDYGQWFGRTETPPPAVYFSGTVPLFKAARSRGQLRLAQRFLRRVPQRVLDVGAGLGTTLFVARREFWPSAVCVGIEPDATCAPYLDAAGVTQVRGMSDVAPGSIDLAVCSHTLEHVRPADITDAVRAIVATLAPGGVLVGEVPHANLFSHVWQHARSHEPHLLFFTPAGIRRLLAGAGGTIAFVETVGERQGRRSPLEAGADKMQRLLQWALTRQPRATVELYGGPRQAIRFVITT